MFHVGQLVLCIDDDFDRASSEEVLPTKGTVYTVRDLDPSFGTSACYDVDCIRLVEITNPQHKYLEGTGEASFACENFVPVEESRVAIFHKMLASTPKTTVAA